MIGHYSQVPIMLIKISPSDPQYHLLHLWLFCYIVVRAPTNPFASLWAILKQTVTVWVYD